MARDWKKISRKLLAKMTFKKSSPHYKKSAAEGVAEKERRNKILKFVHEMGLLKQKVDNSCNGHSKKIIVSAQ